MDCAVTESGGVDWVDKLFDTEVVSIGVGSSLGVSDSSCCSDLD